MSDMSLETLRQVTQPKVEGSLILDELFDTDTLDFFVFCSSVSSVIGNPGQSPYGAANLFMESLAESRRRRGLAASIIHIGPVRGVGHMAQEHIESEELTTRLSAYSHLSEHDFHQLFAEAVVAGRDGPVSITTGIRPVRPDEAVRPRWDGNPMFNHLHLNAEGGAGQDASAASCKRTTTRASIKKMLAGARSADDVYALVRGAVLGRLGVLFQRDFDADATTTTAEGAHDGLDGSRLDELGIDSLMAVEMRSWFAGQLGVNVPVLKMLSGISIRQLVMAAVDGLDAALIPNVVSAAPPVPQIEIEITVDAACSTEHNSAPGSVGGGAKTPSLTATEEDEDEYDDEDHRTGPPSIAESMPSEVSSCDHAMAKQTETDAPLAPQPPPPAPFGLSLAQGMLHVASSMFDDRTSLNFTGYMRLRGPLRTGDLDRAVRAVGQQHESLRTCFLVHDHGGGGGRPTQAVMETSALRLEHGTAASEAEAVQMVAALHRGHVYDLARGQTVRIVLLTVSAVEHYLVIGSHGLVMDGVSTQVLLADLLGHYSDARYGAATPQFRAHVERQAADLASGRYDDALRYWRGQYPSSFPPTLPILRVSRATARSSLAAYDNVRADARVSRDVKALVQGVCRRYRATPFHFYLACFRVLLALWSCGGGGSGEEGEEGEDVSIGIGDANRTEEHMMRAIGVFVNVLPIRFAPSPGQRRFGDVLRETREGVYKALENSAVPFQALLNQ